MIDESFTDIVKTMSHLCLQSEGKGQQNLTVLKHNNHSSLVHSNSVNNNLLKPLFEFGTHIQSIQLFIEAAKPEQCDQAITATTEVTISLSVLSRKKKLITHTCLFCFKNAQHLCAQSFSIIVSLHNHYCMIHFQYQISAFLCPILSCDKLILNLNHFVNHAVTVHKSDLDVRAFIMRVQKHTVKSETLISFTL